jgi:hypothetical protein
MPGQVIDGIGGQIESLETQELQHENAQLSEKGSYARAGERLWNRRICSREENAVAQSLRHAGESQVQEEE